uniref:Alginate lyase family protein n=1 Tax=Roseihalotalea indica TaxID=2867963 RepID=A0AA49JHB4_9BACT|nr:alginate lyase family protein [Tunicatimonas sp. TK19036]
MNPQRIIIKHNSLIKHITFPKLFLLYFLITHNLPAQISPTEYSLETLVQQQPTTIKTLFQELDLTRPGLQKTKSYVQQADWVAACEALLDYYQQAAPQNRFYRKPIPPSQKTDSLGEAIRRGSFTFQNVTGTVPISPSGQLDWQYLGPKEDKEWGYFLNRHQGLVELLQAYKNTGNEVYAQTCASLLLDWIKQNPPPTEDVRTVTWRQLEVGKRLSAAWPQLFYGFMATDAFAPAAKILMLSSIPAHARHIKQHHLRHENWTIMEMHGLASAALYWPEFKEANTWYKYSLEQMQHEAQYQLYPDGAQTELSVGYHYVSLNNFNKFIELLGEQQKPVPEPLHQAVEQMYNYLTYTLRPNATNPLNNDSDLRNYQDIVLDAARRYRRPDWTYIATNGQQGSSPAGPASRFFPWAGQAVLRSGWEADAQWAFFDMGPWGTAHQHNDKLHLSLSAFGQDLLVDAGRYWYRHDEWRDYFTGSASHNVILIDGYGQLPTEERAEHPISGQSSIQEVFDFCYATYDGGYGSDEQHVSSNARHSRAVVQLKEEGLWLVVDQVTTNQPREISALWHMHPNLRVRSSGQSISGTTNNLSFSITLLADLPWKTEVVRGQTQPTIQGWHSEQYNQKQEAACAIFEGTTSETQVFGWLMQAHPSDATNWQATLLKQSEQSLQIRLDNKHGDTREVIISFDPSVPATFTNGYELQGRFGMISSGQPPQVALGKLYDQHELISEDHEDGQ